MTHQAMGRSATTAVFALTLSTLLGLALLGLYSRGDEPSGLTLADLDRSHQTLMSCDAPADDAEPMWCADPSDPQCIPAAPTHRQPDLLSGAQPIVQTASWKMPAHPRGRHLLGWSRPEPRREPKQARAGRLERPPRS